MPDSIPGRIVAAQLPIAADRHRREPQFANAPARKAGTLLWSIAAGIPAAGLLALGGASGHPWAAIEGVAGAAALALLVAWGNWILDNEMM